MRLMSLTACGGLVLAFALLAAPPASAAQFGAVAHDAKTGRAGLSSHHKSLKEAEKAALGKCRAPGCRIVLKFGAKSCAALATEKNGKAWGAARRKTRDEAGAGALADCRKDASGECAVRLSGCNK